MSDQDDDLTVDELRCIIVDKLLDLEGPEVVGYVRQLLIDAMDILEQTDEEQIVVAAFEALEAACHGEDEN